MIKAIVFDCFGVLTTDGWLPFKQKYFGDKPELLEEAGDLNKQNGAGFINQSDFYGRIATMAGLTPAQVAREIDASTTNTELFSYIETKLKSDYRIGLLSNAGDNYLHQLFTSQQVRLFDQIALSYEMGTIKPDRRAYTTILDRLQVEPEQAVFIDDAERHCSGAREVGMQAIEYKDFAGFKAELQSILSTTA